MKLSITQRAKVLDVFGGIWVSIHEAYGEIMKNKKVILPKYPRSIFALPIEIVIEAINDELNDHELGIDAESLKTLLLCIQLDTIDDKDWPTYVKDNYASLARCNVKAIINV